MRLAAGLRPDPLGSYRAPPDLLSVTGGGGGKWKERVGNREERKEGRQGCNSRGDRGDMTPHFLGWGDIV